MDCEQFRKEELFADYLLDRLSGAQREEMELHFFQCRECFEELQAQMAVREALRRTRRFARLRWIGLAAAAAAVCAIVLYPRPKAEPVRQVAVEPAAEPDRYAELARVEPPPYQRVILREAGDQADVVFEAAMDHYMAGRYESAAEGLGKAAELNPRAPAPSYYLGICLLVAGRPEEAGRTLGAVVALEDTPYLEGAHFYLAKASLRLKRVDEARRHLQQVLELRDRLEPEARRLLRSLDILSK